jgi:hypothetical protein
LGGRVHHPVGRSGGPIRACPDARASCPIGKIRGTVLAARLGQDEESGGTCDQARPRRTGERGSGGRSDLLNLRQFEEVARTITHRVANMKLEDFKQELRTSLEKICAQRHWSFDNNKQRGMAFEDWCFDLFCERYPAADNDPNECIIRRDDAGIDIFFESKETDEIYILQCKHPKIKQSDPIPEEDVKAFFSNYALLRDKVYLRRRQTNNPKLEELAVEFEHWLKSGHVINFIFISNGAATQKTSALVEKFNREYSNDSVKFEVWDISALRDEFVSEQRICQTDPDASLGKGGRLGSSRPTNSKLRSTPNKASFSTSN